VGFFHRLRQAGLPIAAGASGEMMRAVEVIGLAPPGDVFYALRALCCTSVEQYDRFAAVFVDYFRQRIPAGLVATQPRTREWTIRGEEEGEGGGGESVRAARGASDTERLRQKDFATLTTAEAAAVRSLIEAMAWSLARARSRRHRSASRPGRPDLRRTLRGSVSPEADMVRLAYQERKERQRPLLFIADVSGSMERYSEMLLYFAHAVRDRLGRMEAFVFATHLTRITRQLERRDPSQAIAQVSRAVTDWSSGTRIGEAIATFNRDWARRVGRGGPIAIIVSDGWDRGDPAVLADEMARLRRSVHRVIWLNPLSGREGYQPLTRGMQAALPYVDDFLPVGNVANLEKVVQMLDSIPVRARS